MEVKMYVYHGMGKRKAVKYKSTKKKEPYGRDDVLKRVPCMLCGANVSFSVLKGEEGYDTRRNYLKRMDAKTRATMAPRDY